MTEFRCVMLCLCPHVARQDRSFGRIVPYAFDTEEGFEFDFGRRKTRQ